MPSKLLTSTMPTVKLIYDDDCPNVPRARENLLRAFSQEGLAPHWQEWDRVASLKHDTG